MTERLKNNGFEQDWGDEKSHRCLIVRSANDSGRQDVGNIFTPPSWLTWFHHDPDEWDQPEARDAWVSGDSARVHGGQKAMLLFTFFRKHDAGFLQQVDVEPGTTVRLSAYAHAWSNSKDGPHPDDPRWSEGPGHQAGFCLEEEAPNDDWANFTFRVGIDPTGGTNPLSDSVIWGQGAHIYNEYAQVPAVEAVTQADMVTVFLRSTTRWAFKHNDAYWDDVELELRGATQVREYERTAVLLPPDATFEEAVALLSKYWDRRYTFTFSADDAGIEAPGLTRRGVIAVRPEAWPGDLREFFDTYYSGVELEEEGNTPAPPQPSELRLRYPTTHMPPHITSRYGEDRGTYIHKGLDLRSSWQMWGDEILCALPAEVILPGRDPNHPGYGVQVRTRTVLEDGREVLVRYAHLVEDGVYVQAGDNLAASQKIGRPGSTGNSTGDHLHIDVMVDGAYVDPEPLIDWPEEEPSPNPTPTPVSRKTMGHVGLHLQVMAAGWDEFTAEVQPSVMKVLASMQDVLGIKRASPETTVVWRHVDDNYGGIWDVDAQTGAQRWIAKFRDSLYEVCNRMAQEMPHLETPYFVVESINEMVNQNEDVVRHLVDFDMAFIDELEKLGLPIVPGVFTAAVGNPHESQYDLLVPLAARCEEAGGYIGYHNYWRAINGESLAEAEWPYYGGRWAEMDRVFVANGVHVKWYGGESGPYASCVDGWLASNCYDGNWDKALQDILWADEWIANWNKYNEDRFLGFVLFTTGAGYTGWEKFQIQTAQMHSLKEALLARYA